MPVELSWPAVVCLGTAAVTAAVAGLAWRRRERTGALLWFATVAAISVWAGSYGLGLLVFDPAVRRIGEQAAIDDFPTPVAVVDSADALTRPLSALTDADIDFIASGRVVDTDRRIAVRTVQTGYSSPFVTVGRPSFSTSTNTD